MICVAGPSLKLRGFAGPIGGRFVISCKLHAHRLEVPRRDSLFHRSKADSSLIPLLTTMRHETSTRSYLDKAL